MTLRRILAAGAVCIILALCLSHALRGTGGRPQTRAQAVTVPPPDFIPGRSSNPIPVGRLTASLGLPTKQVPPVPLTKEGKRALNRGIAALGQRNLPEAARAFDHAVKTDPLSPLAQDYLGIACLQQGKLDEALKHFREEIRLDPDPSTGWARIADVYYAKRNVKDAIQALERAVAFRPDRAQLHYNLGMLYSQGLDMNKAVDSLERYSALEPNNHYAIYLRGSLLYKLVRLDDAEKILIEALRLAPNVGSYHFALGQVHFRRTASPEVTRRAFSEFQKAREDNAPKADTAYYLGLCYQRMGEWDAAQRELVTAAGLSPDSWGAYYALAKVLEKQGRLEEAKKAREKFTVLRAKEDLRAEGAFYQQEVERNPESADAHYQLATFLMRHGDRQGAGKALARATELVNTQKQDAELRRRIAALSTEISRSRVR